jgi:hypothetical protein
VNFLKKFKLVSLSGKSSTLFIFDAAPVIKACNMEKDLPFSEKGKVKSRMLAFKSKLQILFFSSNPIFKSIPQLELSMLFCLNIEPSKWTNCIDLCIVSKNSICLFSGA